MYRASLYIHAWLQIGHAHTIFRSQVINRSPPCKCPPPVFGLFSVSTHVPGKHPPLFFSIPTRCQPHFFTWLSPTCVRFFSMYVKWHFVVSMMSFQPIYVTIVEKTVHWMPEQGGGHGTDGRARNGSRHFLCAKIGRTFVAWLFRIWPCDIIVWPLV